MSFFDIVLLALIAGFALFGFWFGLISTLGSIAGSVVGVFVASRFYAIPAAALMKFTGWEGNFSNVVSFIVLFLLINRLVGLAFYLLDKLLYIFTRLPFLSGINRILGLIFGIAEGVIFFGVLFFMIQKYPLWPSFMSHVRVSKIVPFCIEAASFLWPLLPNIMKV